MGQPRNDVIDILLVDDRPENLLALEAVLQDPGYRLISANSGDEALRYLLDNEPALILMDVQMPVLDGFETASIIKRSERTRDIPIVFITAISKEERFVQQGYRGGAVDYVYKPFDPEILRAKVAVFADLHRKNQLLLRAERILRENELREQERRLRELEIRALRREQAEQRRYRDLVHGIHHAIVWSSDPTGKLMRYVSPSAEVIAGWPRERWFEEKEFWIAHVHPDDREKVRDAMTCAAARDFESLVEHRFLHAKDGKHLWFQTGFRNGYSTETGEPELRGLSVDVTALKVAEHELRRSKERSDFMAVAGLLLGEGLEFSDVVTKIGGIVIPALADAYVVDEIGEDGAIEELAAAPAEPDIRELARDIVRISRVGTTGEPELHTERPEGAVLVVPLRSRGRVLATLTLIRRAPGAGFDSDDRSFAEDLGRRVALALDNANLYRAAQAAIRARDEFLSIASHELKTPLTPLKLQAQGLARMLRNEEGGAVDAARLRRIVDTSDRQIERLSRLIDELLDLSRINMGRLSLCPEEFDGAEFLREITERFAIQLQETGCALELALDETLAVRWDRFRVEQVIVNLLTNAMKYGAGKPVKIEARRLDGRIRISVRDGGIGIAAEDQARIFQRFERAVSGNTFSGLGLGLYIVSEILLAHGGRIWVESEPGHGSLFVVELPERVTEDAPGLRSAVAADSGSRSAAASPTPA